MKKIRWTEITKQVWIRFSNWKLLIIPVLNEPRCVLGYMRTAKAQISLRIRAVWSGPSLSANIIMDTIDFFNGEQIPGWDFAHVQEWCWSLHFAHARRHFFAWRGPYYGSTCIHDIEMLTLLMYLWIATIPASWSSDRPRAEISSISSSEPILDCKGKEKKYISKFLLIAWNNNCFFWRLFYSVSFLNLSHIILKRYRFITRLLIPVSCSWSVTVPSVWKSRAILDLPCP